MAIFIDEFNALQATAPPRVFVDDFNVSSTGTTVDPLPGAPTIVSLTPLGGAATLTLTAPSYMGTGTFAAYRITVAGLTYLITGTSATLLGLPNGSPLVVSVTTETDVGSSAAATALVTPDEPPAGATLPGAPTSLVVTLYDGALGLSWTAPASFGTYAFSDYLVTATSLVDTRYYPVSGTSLIAGNLTNDMEWTISVVARTGAGSGPPLTGTATPVETSGAAPSPVLPYTTAPFTPTPGASPTFPVGYIPPVQEAPADVPPDLPPVPVYVPAPSIIAFYPDGVNDSAGYFNPSNWAGIQ